MHIISHPVSISIIVLMQRGAKLLSTKKSLGLLLICSILLTKFLMHAEYDDVAALGATSRADFSDSENLQSVPVEVHA